MIKFHKINANPGDAPDVEMYGTFSIDDLLVIVDEMRELYAEKPADVQMAEAGAARLPGLDDE